MTFTEGDVRYSTLATGLFLTEGGGAMSNVPSQILVPVMHGVTFEELDQVTPTLASRGGFSTAEEPMEDIAVKIAELVGIVTEEEADELNMVTATS
ncbi:hypothetical protein IFU30_00460 [Plantibacter sp. CFBP 8798]|uniref:hypothetical protein n=1 Tax=Plantibacter sp. CFBP 8798 TaxID=2775268 RepID=UPI001781E8E2|nr:hypothetical protein [Plantibacter sp. CFBP 8798]MBD8464725.1 hypothetical protein [Plantibacter sp. CFBP 8798]